MTTDVRFFSQSQANIIGAGTVKWYDASKGYGFIVPDKGSDDVLLHQRCLQAVGYGAVFEGTRIHYEAQLRPKGWCVLRITKLDDSKAIHPAELPQRTHRHVKAESDWEMVEVKWFSRVRGYGFLTRGEGTRDIFVHMETVKQFGLSGLDNGQMVYVRWGITSQGLMAAELKLK